MTGNFTLNAILGDNFPEEINNGQIIIMHFSTIVEQLLGTFLFDFWKEIFQI